MIIDDSLDMGMRWYIPLQLMILDGHLAIRSITNPSRVLHRTSFTFPTLHKMFRISPFAILVIVRLADAEIWRWIP